MPPACVCVYVCVRLLPKMKIVAGIITAFVLVWPLLLVLLVKWSLVIQIFRFFPFVRRHTRFRFVRCCLHHTKRWAFNYSRCLARFLWTKYGFGVWTSFFPLLLAEQFTHQAKPYGFAFITYPNTYSARPETSVLQKVDKCTWRVYDGSCKLWERQTASVE